MFAATGRLRYASFLIVLIICALLLLIRVMYLFLADAHRFPVSTVKISANYQHVSRKQLESVLTNYLQESFIMLPLNRLRADLLGLDWTDSVEIERVWPDTLRIVFVEKRPIAVWNKSLMTADGHVFTIDNELRDESLPHLGGPEQQQRDVLQNYQKLSKLLTTYGLRVAALQLRENQAWELSLTNGIHLQLGKRDMEKRLLRFCRAYPTVFADKPEQLARVDLRYARGMAVQWIQQTGI